MNAKVENKRLSETGLKNTKLRQAGRAPNAPLRIIAQNLPGGDLRIPLAATRADLQLLMDRPVAPEHYLDEFQVTLLGNPVPDVLYPRQLLGPVAGRTWPRPLVVPQRLLVEHRVPATPTQYQLEFLWWERGSNISTPEITTFLIDLTPPYKEKDPPKDLSPAAASFPADLPRTQDIDDDYIADHPGGIVITLPTAYPNYQATDTVAVFWGIPSSPSYATPVLPRVPLPANGEITIPISVFENSEDGLNRLTFVVTDLAGNPSKRSSPGERNVKRLAPPVALQPIVPLADGTDGDTLIDLADCATGVTVEVTVPLPNGSRDSIIAYWADEYLGEQYVGTETLLVFPVDYATVIKPKYGNTDGIVPTHVHYEMFRRSGPPIAQSDTDIDVDISYEGPVLPNEPDPVNDDLELPRLVSFSGVENELGDDDFNQPAEIFIKLWAAPPTEEGQIVTVFYDDVALRPIYLVSGQEDTEVSTEVDWATIALKNHRTVQVRWELTSIDGNNPIKSLAEDVLVAITEITLLAPQVQGLTGGGTLISCPTLNFEAAPPDPRRNLTVVIPYSPALIDGRTVTLRSAGYRDDLATDLILGTEVTKDHPIVGTVPPEGIEMNIGDYFINFKPAHDGYVKVTYTVTSVASESDPSIHEVWLLAGNIFCEVARPIPGP